MEQIEKYIKDLKQTLDNLNINDIERVANVFIEARNNNKQIIIT
jgi:hypothetical protein